MRGSSLRLDFDVDEQGQEPMREAGPCGDDNKRSKSNGRARTTARQEQRRMWGSFAALRMTDVGWRVDHPIR